jgi:carbon-monoxide dehydrogenase large subunit
MSVRAVAGDRQRRKALDPDAPLIRDDKIGQRDNLASPTWEAGDQAATDRVFAEADTVVARHHLSALPSAPLETCGMIADFNPRPASSTSWQQQAPTPPHGLRARRGTRRHMIRIKCSDIAAASATRSRVSGYVCAIAGSIVAGCR